MEKQYGTITILFRRDTGQYRDGIEKNRTWDGRKGAKSGSQRLYHQYAKGLAANDVYNMTV